MSKLLPITTYGMDILRREAGKIENVDTDLILTVENMMRTMHNADGIGLAAPQINKNISLTVIDISGVEGHEDFKPLTLINPEIIETHGEVVMEEGCLSIPDIRADVSRPEEIHFKYMDLNMEEHTMEAGELLARVVQHEIDHLHGKLFIDYLDADEMKKFKKKLKNIKNKKVDPPYPLYIFAETLT